MSNANSQAIAVLSKEIRTATQQAVGNASFSRFYRGIVLKMVKEGTYQVSLNDQIAELPVYGSGFFKPLEKVWIIAPDNTIDLAKMFILGTGNAGGDDTESEDHKILMQLVEDCANKLDKGAVVQTKGDSQNNVMSQKAVTELFDSIGSSGIQGVFVGKTPLVVDDEQKVSIPIANPSTLGVVKSLLTDNGVEVKSDGTMQVYAVELMKITQAEDTILILDSGKAQD